MKLIREIKSKGGVIHFQRWMVLDTLWFKIYLHKLSRSDTDKHMHDHPWNFISLILKGSYEEFTLKKPYWDKFVKKTYSVGSVIKHNHTDAHKITLLTPDVWTLVFIGSKRFDWGYQTEKGWMSNKEYRKWKHGGFK